MPTFAYTPQSINDPSQLSEGWHPAMLIAILDEETPAGWEMAKTSARMWRWCFAVWQHPDIMTTQHPELQSSPTSQKFSSGGKYQPSKAYVWTCQLLGKTIQPGESVDLDPLMPLPCLLEVKRTNKLGQPVEYATITNLRPWPEGAQMLTPDFTGRLSTWWTMKQATPPPAAPPTPQPQYHQPQWQPPQPGPQVSPPAPAPAPAPPHPASTKVNW
jgi:hypothetical protein